MIVLEKRSKGTEIRSRSLKTGASDICSKPLKTPLGEILRWRLLLFQISRDSVSGRHAEWDEDEQVLTYEDTELHLDQIPILLACEYDECRRILYEDLMFGLKDLRRMHAWSLKDNPAAAVVGWEFTQHRENAYLLQVRTREEANELSGLLQCDSYTSESEKHILTTWVASANLPYIVATTALAEGLDYPHVRVVVNVNDPESLVTFAQESGRAGRDGLKAYSLVLLAPTWKPQSEGEDTLICQMLASSH